MGAWRPYRPSGWVAESDDDLRTMLRKDDMNDWTPVDWWLFVTGALLAPIFTASVMAVVWNIRKKREFDRMADEFNRQIEEERKRDKIED